MSQDRARIAHFFDATSGVYAEASAAVAHHHGAARAFLAESVTPGCRLLDLGCGPGHLTGDLPPDVLVVGLDVSARMVEEARRTRPAGTYLVHDFHRPLPAGLGPFDAVLATGTFEFCEDLPTALGNVAAALTPGGRLHFTVAEALGQQTLGGGRAVEATGGRAGVHVIFWTFAETVRALEAAGLRPLTYRYGPGWDSAVLAATVHYGYWVVERPRQAEPTPTTA